MHLDPLLPSLAGLVLAILLTGIVMRVLRQPFIIGCLLVGVLLGPHGLDWLGDADTLARIGAFGVVLLLFFMGMETNPRELAASWRVAVVGTILQIAASVGCVAAIGLWFDWSWNRILLLGFVISLSSTAVVMRILERRGEASSPAGRNAVVILLSQDILVAPMLVTISLLAGADEQLPSAPVQIAGGILCVLAFVWMVRQGELRLGFLARLKQDRELALFAALAPCLLLALLSGQLGLSTGLGAFMGGMLLGMTREVRWVVDSLKSFEIVFVGVFFLSVGSLLDLGFLRLNVVQVGLLVLLVLLTNTLINTLILRALGSSWRDGLYTGALLAQIGEFSFVLAALGQQTGLIQQPAYQMTVATIALSMLFSPAWIGLFRRPAPAGDHA